MENPAIKLIQDLQSYIQKLDARVSKLEKENDRLKKWVMREKKKVCVVEWLNQNYHPELSFEEWQTNIKVSVKDLHLVFKNSLSLGMYYIIMNNLPLEKRRHFPIVAFKKGGMSFYIYNGKKWQKMSIKQFEVLLREINRKLFPAFTTWETNNPHIMEEPCRKQWNIHLKKILLLDEKLDGIVRKIRKRIYQYVKLELKNITEYEFTF